MRLFQDLKADASVAEVLISQAKLLRVQGNTEAAYEAANRALRLAQATAPRLFVAASMEELAHSVMQQGHVEQAVQLLATAASLRLQIGAPIRPADQAAVASTVATAQSMLGDEIFKALWAQAQTLSA